MERRGEIIESYVIPGIRGIGFRDMAKIRFENGGGPDTVTVKHTGLRLNKGDSVLFSLNVRKPGKSIVRRVIYRYDGSESYIPIDTPREKLSQYHGIDRKPLFEGVTDYAKNDSVVEQFLKKELLKVQQGVSGRIGLYLIIDKEGKASLGKVFDSDRATESNLRQIVANMPLFEPGEHKGEKVNVSYLVEIK